MAPNEDREVLEFWRDRFKRADVAFTQDRTIGLVERRALGAVQQDLLDAIVGAEHDDWFTSKGCPFELIFNKQGRFEQWRDVGRDVRSGKPPPAKTTRVEHHQPNTGVYSAIAHARRDK
jgi:hypothetical protein